MKIAAITPVSGPYIVARYSAFATNYPQHSLFLVELGKTSTTYPWNHPNFSLPYKRVVLCEQPTELQLSWNLFKNVFKVLNEIQPDLVVICGYGVKGMLQTFCWSLLHHKPTILLSDSKEDDAQRNWWTEAIKSLIVKSFRAALVGGKPHKYYLAKLGMPVERIFFPYDVIGNQDFHPDRIKDLPNLVNKPYFLASNRFVAKKNLPLLISAYADYRHKAGKDAWDLVLCGDGELRSQLEAQISSLNLKDCLHLPGFLQHQQLLPYFAHASCFVHASIQEQWGLVVNEAMAAGLPVLVSNRCGCFEDLVIEGVNGFGFNPENPQQLTELMLKMSSGDVNLEAMGEASFQQIQNFSPDRFAIGLKQAIDRALNHPQIPSDRKHENLNYHTLSRS